jgi:hypothetical protein
MKSKTVVTPPNITVGLLFKDKKTSITYKVICVENKYYVKHPSLEEYDPRTDGHVQNIRVVYLKSVTDVSTSRQPMIIFGMPHKPVITLPINKLLHLNQLQFTESFFQTLVLNKIMRQC